MAMIDEIKEFAEKPPTRACAIRKNSGMTSNEEFQSMLLRRD